MSDQEFDVSIVIPTYNRENSVIETIQSALHQSLPAFEIIVVDDGSTDNTREKICTIFGSKVIYHYQKNAGVSAARNQGIKLARGNWIAFLDSDDIWQRDKLKDDNEQRQSSEQIDFIHGDRALELPTGQVNSGRDHEIAHDFCNKEFLLSTWTIKTSTVVVKKKLLMQLDQHFNTNLKTCEDYELFWRAVISSRKISYSHKANVLIKITPCSLSRNPNEQQRFIDNMEAMANTIKWAIQQNHTCIESILQTRLGYEFIRYVIATKNKNGILAMCSTFFTKNEHISIQRKMFSLIKYIVK